jgi:hypothetical protein
LLGSVKLALLGSFFNNGLCLGLSFRLGIGVAARVAVRLGIVRIS